MTQTEKLQEQKSITLVCSEILVLNKMPHI